MLYGENMKPALAAAGTNSAFNMHTNEKKRSFVFAGEDSASDDFGSFGPSASSTKKKTSKPSNKKPSRKKIHIPVKAIIIAAIALVTVIAIIWGLTALLLNSPKKGIVAEDNVFFVITDSDGKNRVVSNGKLLKDVFNGEITLTPSADASFAYISEKIDTEDGEKESLYILENSKIKDLQIKANEILDLAPYGKGILYTEIVGDDTRVHCYSDNSFSSITSSPWADNFIISGDGTTVVYTMEDNNNPGRFTLEYFQDSSSDTVEAVANFIPVAISNDGRFVYGTPANPDLGEDLYVIDLKKGPEKATEPVRITEEKTNGSYQGIIAMNKKGDEIIFFTETDKGYESYFYNVSDDNPKGISSQGIVMPLYTDTKVVCPDTFIKSCFVCSTEIIDDDGNEKDITSTYYLDKKGARKIADAEGEFSADGKYFYFKDEHSTLYRVSLSSKDFEEDTETIANYVLDYAIVEKGNVYIMSDNGATTGTVYYWKASTGKNTIISSNAILDSMEQSANSVYFAEKGKEQTTICVSTSGSALEKASFKTDLEETPEIKMGYGDKGYAYFVDDSGAVNLYYTSNGKKFSLVTKDCTVDGVDTESTEEPTDSSEQN